MKDSWCKKIRTKNGTVVSGGAARAVRIANRGGMDNIIRDTVEEAVKSALSQADQAVRRNNLRLIKTKIA